MQQDSNKNRVNSTLLPQTPWAYFWFITKPFRGWMIAAVVLVIAGGILDRSLAYLFKLIVESVEAADYSGALWFALAYPAGVLLVQLLFRGSGHVGGYFTMQTMKHSYDTLAQHVFKHSHSYFINRFAGSLLSKISNVVDAGDKIIQNTLWSHLTAAVSLLVTLGFITLIDWRAGLVFLGLIGALLDHTQKYHSFHSTHTVWRF